MDDLAGKISEILTTRPAWRKSKTSLICWESRRTVRTPAPPFRLLPHRLRTPTLWKPCWAAWAETDSAGGLGALAGLSGLGAGGGNQSVSPEMLQSILKIAPLLSSVQQEDDNTRLLYALRPFLKPQRQKRLDESANMMRMFKLLPLLKGSGI